MVQLTGLKDEKSNGLTGMLVKFDENIKRWVVKISE